MLAGEKLHPAEQIGLSRLGDTVIRCLTDAFIACAAGENVALRITNYALSHGGGLVAFVQLIQNKPLGCAASAWFLAQVIKAVLYWAIEKKFDWKRIWGSGGMPSSHSAFVLALAVALGLENGFDSPAFAVSFALMAIVIYDAMGVRYETGKQGQIINKILAELFVEGKPLTDDRLKELVGHSPLEVLGGLIVGVVCLLVFYL